MKVLITGGAGFIGFHLAKYLANLDYNITIIDNFERGSKDENFKELINRKNVIFIKGDVTLSKTFDKLDTDYEYIYHLAAINGTANFYNIPDKVLKIGVFGIINILEWFVKCRKTNNKAKLLFSSSSETYAAGVKLFGDKFPIPTPEEVPLIIGDPKNVRVCYGTGKIVGEVALYAYSKVYGIKDFVIVRYHNIYGPRMGFDHVVPQFIERIVKKEEPFKIFGSQETRSFCYIDDCIMATKIVMESQFSNECIINIGRDDDEIKIIDLAKKLFEIVGINPSLEIKEAPKGSVSRRCPDISKLKKLGFTPKIGFKEGLKNCYDWYKAGLR